MTTVNCGEHGRREAAFACAHVLQSLGDGTPRGLHWCRDGDGAFNGWCAECDVRLEAAGGAWDEATEAAADIQLLCEDCFRRAMALNGVVEGKH